MAGGTQIDSRETNMEIPSPIATLRSVHRPTTDPSKPDLKVWSSLAPVNNIPSEKVIGDYLCWFGGPKYLVRRWQWIPRVYSGPTPTAPASDGLRGR